MPASLIAPERLDPGAQPQRHPVLYEINTRAWLTELSDSLNRPATLDDIPDTTFDQLADRGVAWIWLLSVWQTGPAGQQISRVNPELRRELARIMPTAREEDIAGSGFAIKSYTVDERLGGETALARLRNRIRQRGLRLMLDFVPNHTAVDHVWVEAHPEYYVAGTEADLARAPRNYTWIRRTGGARLLAHGRDPYFPGWPDTVQLNYANPRTHEAMIAELETVSEHCDGVRCDMAMLVLPDVFARTWGLEAQAFWPRAIERVRARTPDFCFIAEVYWELEDTLLQQGFDYAYDKSLYDRLRAGVARPVREHLQASLDYQVKLARFLENHDEPRAAATFAPSVHEAAAVIAYLSPGLRLFYQGQFQGRRQRISPHVIRAPQEPTDAKTLLFYENLLTTLRHPAVSDGSWLLLDCTAAWDVNWTWDCYVAWCWRSNHGERLLAIVNYAGNHSQCYVRLPWPDLEHCTVRLADLLGPARYERDGSSLLSRGLYLDLPPWGRHVFTVTPVL